MENKNNKKINYDFTDEITCPYCGVRESDSWENNENDGKEYCGSCYNTFFWERNISITYSSSKE